MFDKVFLQRSYAGLLSSRLNLHKVNQYSPYISNFRCDICGDSQTNKFKRRAYIIEKSGGLFYYCHNCGESSSLENYMKNHHNDIYNQYRLDVLNEISEYNEPKQVKIISNSENFLDSFYITKAIKNNDALRYLKYRKIPENHWDDIYYSEFFKKLVNETLPKFPNSEANERDPRIIFPIRNNGLLGIVGRTIENSPKRFYTIRFDDNSNLLFNIDKVDRFKQIYCTEGPIDSFYLPNSIALCGSDRNLSEYFYDFSKVTIILDNQPRNKEIIRIYQKFIKLGYSIFIWPNNIIEKDINEIIMKDSLKIEELKYIIDKNTLRGIPALARLNEWKRI